MRAVALAVLACLAPLAIHEALAQANTISPFERDYADVKFLDAYFGTFESKIEVEAGDKNVPFTVVFANVGTQDITGIEGQLSLPIGFGPADGPGAMIRADSDSNSRAGETFHLTFFVNIADGTRIGQYPGSAKLEYSKVHESGVRTEFSEFQFKVTGDSVINVSAQDPFLTSLRTNNVVVSISNDGTAPISGVDVVASNTQTELASTSSSITNVENVVILESNWDLGTIEPRSEKQIAATVYVPESLKGDTLRLPLSISYYNAHGDREVISKIVDFYVKGLIDLTVFNVDVIELSGTQMAVGEILNEGNQDGLFGFVSISPREGSNLTYQNQFIDEIEVDAPVPFNLPLEFDGEPRYGEHDVTITVRYKDGVRDELFVGHDATITIPEPAVEEEGPDGSLAVIPVIVGIVVGLYLWRRRKKKVPA